MAAALKAVCNIFGLAITETVLEGEEVNCEEQQSRESWLDSWSGQSPRQRL
jgi:hypothetical protein